MAFEGLLKTLRKADTGFNAALNRIRRPFIESWILPLAVATGLGLESMEVANRVERAITVNQTPIVKTISDVGYDIANDFLPPIAGVTTFGLIGVPAAFALHRYYSRKRRRNSEGILDSIDDLVTGNQIINNRVVLPLVSGAGLSHIAYTYVFDGNSALDILKGVVVFATAATTSLRLCDYFRNASINLPSRTGISPKIPLLYVLAASTLGNAIVDRTLTQLSENRFVLGMFGVVEGSAMEARVRTVEREMTYWDAAEYYSREYDVDPNLVKAFLISESGFEHFEGRRVKKSRSGAYGLGQHKPINIKDLNNSIGRGKLNGEPFIWEEVRDNPAENIRATAATIRNLRDLCGQGMSKVECLEFITAAYIAGKTDIVSGLEDPNNNLWNVIDSFETRRRITTTNHVRTVMAHYLDLTTDFEWAADSRKVNSGYGKRKNREGKGNEMHEGLDIAPTNGSAGDPIYAIADGTVTEVGYNSRKGNYVTIQHGDSSLRLYSTYFHGQPRSTNVKVGTTVAKGEQIMGMGNTGRTSKRWGKGNGVHLHLGVYFESFDGEKDVKHWMDPNTFYRSYGERRVMVPVRELYTDS